MTAVVAVRDQLGAFAGAAELAAFTTLPAHRIDELRDRMIFN